MLQISILHFVDIVVVVERSMLVVVGAVVVGAVVVAAVVIGSTVGGVVLVAV